MKQESFLMSMAKLVITVSLIVGVGAIFGMLNYSLTIPKSEVVVDNVINNKVEKEDIKEDINDEEINTENWETYKNEDYGYEVEYPKEGWILTYNIHQPILAWAANNSINSLNYVNLYTKGNDEEAKTITFSVYEKDPNLSMFQWLFFAVPDILKADKGDLTAAFEKANTGAIGLLTYSEFKDNDIEISEFSIMGSSGYFHYTTYFHGIDSSLIYSIELRFPPYYTSKPEQYIDIYNQILSTFKFIEKDETADWKTYRNEEYGFEVKYPENISFSKYEPPEKKDYKIYNRTIFKIENHSRIEIVVSILDKNKFNLLFNNTEYKKIEIDNHKAFRRNGVGKYYFDIIEILGDKYLYEIKYSDWRVEYDQESLNLIGHIKEEDRDLIAKNELIFNQILSTFKFIEK